MKKVLTYNNIYSILYIEKEKTTK